MAFTRTANRLSENNNGFERATGFLNFYMPTVGGTRRKLTSAPLRNSNAVEAALIAAIQKDPKTLDKILGSLIIEYRDGTPNEDSMFKL